MYTFLFFLLNTKYVTNFRSIIIRRLVPHLSKKCIYKVCWPYANRQSWLARMSRSSRFNYSTLIFDSNFEIGFSRDFSKLVYCKLIHSCGKKCTRVIDPWEPCKGPFGSRPGAKTGWKFPRSWFELLSSWSKSWVGPNFGHGWSIKVYKYIYLGRLWKVSYTRLNFILL